MAPPPPLPPLTLIVATTPTLGIGLRNTLPWPRLPSDLAFFARITKRPPNPTTRTKNAVIMGRKTWASLPPHARPLKGRINVVLSRNEQRLDIAEKEREGEDVLGASGIEDALRRLREGFAGRGGVEAGKEGEEEGGMALGRVFVIGGAEVYRSALGMGCCERILWTRVGGEWECDVFFPEGVLGGEGDGGWRVRGEGELEAWVGEEGVGGVRREGGVEFQIRMLERGGEAAFG